MLIPLPDEEATARLAGTLARGLTSPAGWTVLLQGELGAGKSTLARAFLRALGHEGAVPSPTYTLVEPYEFPEFSVYHIDLYRINGLEELDYLGWGDLRDGLILVEWPERAPELLERADLLIKLAYAGDGRIVELETLSPRAQDLVAAIDKDAISGD